MIITKERTRLIFTEYNSSERTKIENLVATVDKILFYEDVDNEKICIPTGMVDNVKKTFPKVKIVDNSATYWDYARITPVTHEAEPRNQLQIDFIKFLLVNVNKKQKTAGILSPGTGKMEPYSRKIPTPDGWRRMGDLKVGDKIFGSNGKQITVTNIFDHGVQDIYKITFNDGRTAQCGADHLWNVVHPWMSKQKTIALKDMIDDYKVYRPFKRDDGSNRDMYDYKYRIPVLSDPVQYNYRSVPIDPYVLGAFIGNGCCTLYPLTISSGDDFVPNKIADICGIIASKQKTGYSYTFKDPNNELKRITSRDFFKEVPEIIDSYSRDKIIPDIYLYNDISVRMELLRGLMDTDGSITYADGRYHVRYSSCSKKLLEQVKCILMGLGFNGTIQDDNRVDKYISGYHGNLLFHIPHSFKRELFTHPKKSYQAMKCANLPSAHRTANYLIIKDIQLIKREEARCISVDAEDQLYLTEDFIVTHNTFMACYAAIKAQFRTLIVVPTTNIKDQWAETLIDMFNVPAERVLNVKSPKEFINVKADFVVVSQATLSVLNKTYDLEKIMKTNKFGIKVIDEVQMWFHNIIKVDACSNICHNWYLTGTFGRSGEEENNLYQEMFGDLSIFREKDKAPTLFNRKPGNVYGMKPHMNVTMMWTKSGLSAEQIKSVTSSMRYSEREGRWMRYGISIPAYTALVIPKDGQRTQFLDKILQTVKIANKEVTYGKMLILTPTIDSVNVLQKYVQKLYPNTEVGTIHSRNSKAENDRVKAECEIMISTVKSSGTGFDVKGLSKLIVAEQFKSWILADQVSGRLRRRDDGKDTYMWDIVDSDIPQLRVWANVRADILKRKSKKFTVVDL